MKHLILLLAFTLMFPASSLAATHSNHGAEQKAINMAKKEARKSVPILVQTPTTTPSIVIDNNDTVDVSNVVISVEDSTDIDVIPLFPLIVLSTTTDITINSFQIFIGTSSQYGDLIDSEFIFFDPELKVEIEYPLNDISFIISTSTIHTDDNVEFEF
jgi:hypothetical protein